jgi:VanZ family protein
MVMMTDNRPWRAIFWVLALATLWLSLMPAERIPSTFHFWDKAQHALGFAALAGSGLTGYAKQPLRVVLGLVVFGIAIEVMQHLSGWRHGDWLDWVADCAGLLIGYVALRVAHLLRH